MEFTAEKSASAVYPNNKGKSYWLETPLSEDREWLLLCSDHTVVEPQVKTPVLPRYCSLLTLVNYLPSTWIWS